MRLKTCRKTKHKNKKWSDVSARVARIEHLRSDDGLSSDIRRLHIRLSDAVAEYIMI